MKKLFRKVLVVDDDRASRFLCEAVLEDMQVAEAITTYEHGEGALEHLKSSCMDENAARLDCPDLVLLDLNMPIMNGIELLEQLDKLKANHIIQSRVVVLTSSSYSQDIEKTKRYGVKGYIVKPLTEEKVRTLLVSADQPPVV